MFDLDPHAEEFNRKPCVFGQLRKDFVEVVTLQRQSLDASRPVDRHSRVVVSEEYNLDSSRTVFTLAIIVLVVVAVMAPPHPRPIGCRLVPGHCLGPPAGAAPFLLG